MDAIAVPAEDTARDRREVVERDPLFAAIDLGTNNCRLLIAREALDGFRVVDAFSRIVRLGEGVGRTGRLQPEAMRRTVAALRICAGKMRRREVSWSRAVATEACRRAANFPGFRERVWRETGLSLELISTGEEARLALSGCAPLLDPAIDRALVFDIGGGSTELMWLAVDRDGQPGLIDSISIPYGVVSLAEAYGGEHVSVATYEAMIKLAADALGGFERRYDIRRKIADGGVQMVGSSGTVTTLAGVHLRLPRYDRSVVDGSWLDVAAARAVSRNLLALDFERRAAHPCIGRERADLVLAGCAVLEAICDVWPMVRLRVADRGVREGILFDLIEEARGGRLATAGA